MLSPVVYEGAPDIGVGLSGFGIRGCSGAIIRYRVAPKNRLTKATSCYISAKSTFTNRCKDRTTDLVVSPVVADAINGLFSTT